MEGLVGDERTQRVDEDARATAHDGLARGMQVEDEGLARRWP